MSGAPRLQEATILTALNRRLTAQKHGGRGCDYASDHEGEEESEEERNDAEEAEGVEGAEESESDEEDPVKARKEPQRDLSKAPEQVVDPGNPDNNLSVRDVGSTCVVAYGKPSAQIGNTRFFAVIYHTKLGLVGAGDSVKHHAQRRSPAKVMYLVGGLVHRGNGNVHVRNVALLNNRDSGVFEREAALSTLEVVSTFQARCQVANPKLWGRVVTANRAFLDQVRATEAKRAEEVQRSLETRKLRSQRLKSHNEKEHGPALRPHRTPHGQSTKQATSLPTAVVCNWEPGDTVLVVAGAHKNEQGVVTGLAGGLLEVQLVSDGGLGGTIKLRPPSVVDHPSPAALQGLVDSSISAEHHKISLPDISAKTPATKRARSEPELQSQHSQPDPKRCIAVSEADLEVVAQRAFASGASVGHPMVTPPQVFAPCNYPTQIPMSPSKHGISN